MNSLNLKIKSEDKFILYKSNCTFYSLCIQEQYIKLLSELTPCKEMLIYLYSEHINKDYFSDLKLITSFYTASYENLKIKKEKMDKAIKIINMFGDINNWPTTKVYKIKLKYKSKILFLFDLPYQWFKFPQLLSLVTFIIDSCNIYDIKKYNTIENFIKSIKIEETTKINNRNDVDYDTIFFNLIDWVDNLLLIINNYDYIFKNEISKYNYNDQEHFTSSIYKSTKHSGIKSLCLGKSLNTKLNTKLKYLLGER